MKGWFRGYGAAILSAALVGIFTVLNKWLVGQLPALTAGAWTYFAAGVALLPFAVRYGIPRFQNWRVVVGWLLAGSVFGPALYFIGLNLTSGIEGSLLINLEAVLTAFLALVFFKERMSRRTILFGGAIVLGAVVISIPSNGLGTHVWLGNLLIGLGYTAWATENNLGRLLGENISAVTLVCLKALAAGVVMGILALSQHQSLVVPPRAWLGIIASGCVSLGLSLAFFYIAMRHIGAGRTGIISSSATLFGVGGSVVILGESMVLPSVIGGLMILVGLAGMTFDLGTKQSNM